MLARRQVMFRAICSFVLFNLSFSSIAVSAAQTQSILVGSYLTPGIIEADGSGMFNRLNKLIFKELEQPYDLVIQPVHRIKKSLVDGHVKTYFPEMWESLPGRHSDYVVSQPIFYKKVVLFTTKASGFTTLQDLEGKFLGAVDGFSYGFDIIKNPKLNILYQNSDDVNIRLLLNGRLDGVLGGYPGTVIALNRYADKNKIKYDLTKPVAVLESFYVCPKTKAGIALCEKISLGIEALKSKGILVLDSVTGDSKFNP